MSALTSAFSKYFSWFRFYGKIWNKSPSKKFIVLSLSFPFEERNYFFNFAALSTLWEVFHFVMGVGINCDFGISIRFRSPIQAIS